MIIDRVSFLIFVKYPCEGRVKTRLAESIGSKAAVLLYRDFVSICLQRYQQIHTADCTIYFDPTEEEDAFRRWLGSKFHYLSQPPGDLGERLRAGVENQLKYYSRVIALGTDSPDLPLEYLELAADALLTNPLVIGPAQDGGYYLIGLNQFIPVLFRDIPWSTHLVFEKTLEKARSAYLTPIILPEWYDIDTLSDLRRFEKSNDWSVTCTISAGRNP